MMALACGASDEAPPNEDLNLPDREVRPAVTEPEPIETEDVDCESDVDCQALASGAIPQDCAEARCEPFTRRCIFRTRDADGDGHRSNGRPPGATGDQNRCTVLGRTVETGDDCDDANPTIRPGALKTCDGVDRDCDGAVNDRVPACECTPSSPQTIACQNYREGACYRAGVIRCINGAYTPCSAPYVAGSSTWRTSPDPVTGSWDTNCQNGPEKQFTNFEYYASSGGKNMQTANAFRASVVQCQNQDLARLYCSQRNCPSFAFYVARPCGVFDCGQIVWRVVCTGRQPDGTCNGAYSKTDVTLGCR